MNIKHSNYFSYPEEDGVSLLVCHTDTSPSSALWNLWLSCSATVHVLSLLTWESASDYKKHWSWWSLTFRIEINTAFYAIPCTYKLTVSEYQLHDQELILIAN